MAMGSSHCRIGKKDKNLHGMDDIEKEEASEVRDIKRPNTVVITFPFN